MSRDGEYYELGGRMYFVPSDSSEIMIVRDKQDRPITPAGFKSLLDEEEEVGPMPSSSPADQK